MAAHVGNFAGGPPETSNLYCHPGKAGGSPADASYPKSNYDDVNLMLPTIPSDGLRLFDKATTSQRSRPTRALRVAKKLDLSRGSARGMTV